MKEEVKSPGISMGKQRAQRQNYPSDSKENRHPISFIVKLDFSSGTKISPVL